MGELRLKKTKTLIWSEMADMRQQCLLLKVTLKYCQGTREPGGKHPEDEGGGAAARELSQTRPESASPFWGDKAID